MIDEKIKPEDCELSDDELDAVAGGGLLEPIITRNEPISLEINGLDSTVQGRLGGLLNPSRTY